jgi:hypothetical protein
VYCRDLSAQSLCPRPWVCCAWRESESERERERNKPPPVCLRALPPLHRANPQHGASGSTLDGPTREGRIAPHGHTASDEQVCGRRWNKLDDSLCDAASNPALEFSCAAPASCSAWQTGSASSRPAGRDDDVAEGEPREPPERSRTAELKGLMEWTCVHVECQYSATRHSTDDAPSH